MAEEDGCGWGAGETGPGGEAGETGGEAGQTVAVAGFWVVASWAGGQALYECFISGSVGLLVIVLVASETIVGMIDTSGTCNIAQ